MIETTCITEVNELRDAIAGVEGVVDARVGVGLVPDPMLPTFEVVLTPDDARLVAIELRWAKNDAVDRAEVAGVVEQLVELHDAVDGDDGPVCGRCRTDVGGVVPVPCRTRELLRKLPGGDS